MVNVSRSNVKNNFFLSWLFPFVCVCMFCVFVVNGIASSRHVFQFKKLYFSSDSNEATERQINALNHLNHIERYFLGSYCRNVNVSLCACVLCHSNEHTAMKNVLYLEKANSYFHNANTIEIISNGK